MTNLESMDFMTTEECAQILRVKKHTVAQWVRSGLLPSWRSGRKHLIRREDLEKFVVPPKEKR